MQKENVSNKEYSKYVYAAINCFQNGQYGAVLNNLNIVKQMGYKEWKKDFGIMMSQNDEDFWNSLCIFNMCYTGAEAACSSGCCTSCCVMVCGAACVSMCCGGDIDSAGPCLGQTIVGCCTCCCDCLLFDGSC